MSGARVTSPSPVSMVNGYVRDATVPIKKAENTDQDTKKRKTKPAIASQSGSLGDGVSYLVSFNLRQKSKGDQIGDEKIRLEKCKLEEARWNL
ncbi:hypothetical protein L2E82_28889 [Cichorium intybus]|uniref:Uncharacterized protein n=1 Tax=Cichorium intybus TaxID=13427 RepID=A0ACB9CX25_CICIN|nr:hypothetical protein L2E82_28889 [Cichorium intybus]